MNINNAAFLASYGLIDQIPPSNSFEFVFSGRSNVGKSSLINKIFNRKALARVSASPGKTATINFYQADGLHFVDLPGYGYAKVSKSEKQRWSKLIKGYFAQERMFAMVIQLIDMRHAPTKQDLEMIEFWVEIEMPFIIALTKADKLSKNQRNKRLTELEQEIPYADQIKMIPCSVVTGEGISEIHSIIDTIKEGD